MLTDIKLASEKRQDSLLTDEIDRRLDLLLANYQRVTSNPRTMGYLRFLLKHYAKSPTPWRDCYKDNLKRFGPDKTKGLCGVLKDVIRQNVYWRKGAHGHSKLPDVGAPGVAIAYADKGAAPPWGGHKLAEVGGNQPPEFKEGTNQEHCGNCKNYAETIDQGYCSLYSSIRVGKDDWCASWGQSIHNNLDMGEMAMPEEISLILEDLASKCDVYRVLLGLDEPPSEGLAL